MMQPSAFLPQLPFFQVLFCVLSFSSLIWLITAFLALKRSLTRFNNFQKFPPFCNGKNFVLPKVSVVVPARNEEKYIQRCVNSLLAQNYGDLEILVIDDNSSDRTTDILNTVINDNVKVVAVKDLPSGWARKAWACQVGFGHSTGEIILFTDADTNYFDKDAILNSVTEMEASSAKVVTGMPLLELRDFYSKMVMPLLNLFIESFTGLTKTYEDKIIGSFFLVRREVLTSIGGFNKVKNSFQEDTDIGIEIKKLNLKVRRIKLNNMVSAIWSRDYNTLQHGIRRIIAYDVQRKKKGLMLQCLLLFTVVLIPYILLLYNGIIYWNYSSPIRFTLLLWNLTLCIIPTLGYLIVNRVRHKTQTLYSLMALPASCLLLFSFITNLASFTTLRSKKEIVWKGVKYYVTN
jgi:chlorobactene glucosyltransferase